MTHRLQIAPGTTVSVVLVFVGFVLMVVSTEAVSGVTDMHTVIDGDSWQHRRLVGAGFGLLAAMVVAIWEA